MQQDYPQSIIINGEEYFFIKTRLNGGATFVSKNKQKYLRIGDSQQTREEQIHTLSLQQRGFPVPKILESGDYQGKYYFIEESLGDKPFALKFADEYEREKKILDATFGKYLKVMEIYTNALFKTENFHHARSDLINISLIKETMVDYDLSEDILDLIKKAQTRINVLPVVDIHEDLGPFNVLEGGMIDFETPSNARQAGDRLGPLGYDVMVGPFTGYYFPESGNYYHKLLYKFSDHQLIELKIMVETAAKRAGIENIFEYFNDYIFIRTIWASARPRDGKKEYVDPAKEKFWSFFRRNILLHVIHQYMTDKYIDPTNFPSVGISKT